MKKCGEDCRLYMAFEWQSHGVYLEKRGLNPEVVIKNFTCEHTKVIEGDLLIANTHDICKQACLRRTDCLAYVEIKKSENFIENWRGRKTTCYLLKKTKVAGVIPLPNQQRRAHNPSDYDMPVMYEKIATLAESVKSFCLREIKEPKEIARVVRINGKWVVRKPRDYDRCLVQECNERCGGKSDGHKNVNVPCRVSCKEHAGLWAKYRKGSKKETGSKIE